MAATPATTAADADPAGCLRDLLSLVVFAAVVVFAKEPEGVVAATISALVAVLLLRGVLWRR